MTPSPAMNIPTELLRTLLVVVDLRSFTKAAQMLGVTQPAVSAQLKRLQLLLGGELFDKSAPGVTLTQRGEVVVNYARRLLSINDQILDLAAGGPVINRVRIGFPQDFFASAIFQLLTEFRNSHPDLRFQVCADFSDNLLRDLRRGEYDLVVALTVGPETVSAYHSWVEESGWGAASDELLEADDPVPLVGLGENSLSRRLASAALEQFGRKYEIAYQGKSFIGLVTAAKAGVGILPWSRRMLAAQGLAVCESSSKLPKVPNIVGGVYLSEGPNKALLADLADEIGTAVGW